jgi:hypothetical protein
MNSQQTFNGWANYETWCVNLWLTNDEGADCYWREQAADRLAEAEDRPEPHLTPRERARVALADQLRDELTEEESIPGANLYRDLLNAALGEVDWHEVADAFLEDIG